MKTHILKIAVLAIVLLGHLAVAHSALRDAVVKITCTSSDGARLSGSGVCVDKQGVILTVSHLVKHGSCRVWFREKSFPASSVVIPQQEGVAVLKVHAREELPYLEIANSPPEVGEQVWVMGFPSGRWTSFQTIVTTHNLHFSDDPATKLTGVSAPVLFGTSGGPLITRNWKVAGIASVSGKIPPQKQRSSGFQETIRVSGTALEQTGGMYLALEQVQAAYEEFLSRSGSQKRRDINRKPILYAFTTSSCNACRQFKQDYGSGRFSGFEVRMIESGTLGWQTAAAEVHSVTGQPIPNSVPFFWVRGSRRIVQQEAYHAPGLLQILMKIVLGLGRIIFNSDIETSRLYPTPLPGFDSAAPSVSEPSELSALSDVSVSSPDPTLDWSAVTVVVLVARQDVGVIRGQLRKKVLSLSIGPLRRRLMDLSNSRASLEVVSERLTPRRFEAVIEAANLLPDPVLVVVLVSRKDVGMVKSLLVRKIENTLIDKLKQAPLDVIFERAFPDDFAVVKEALQVEESPESGERKTKRPAEDHQPFNDDPWNPRNTIPGLAVAWLTERITTKLKRRFSKREAV